MATTISSGRANSPLLTADVASRAEVYGGRGLVFDGVTDYLDCGTGLGDQLGNNYSGGLSVSMWINVNSSYSSGEKGIFFLGNFGGSYGEFTVNITPTHFVVYVNQNAWQKTFAYTARDIWTHICFVADSQSESNTKFYINGEVQSITTNIGNTFPSYNVSTGEGDLDFSGLKTVIGNFFNGNFPFHGKITDTKLFNTALTEAQVQELYKKPENTPSAVQDNLVAWYPMIEGNPESPQSIVYDHSEKGLGSEALTANDTLTGSTTSNWGFRSGWDSNSKHSNSTLTHNDTSVFSQGALKITATGATGHLAVVLADNNFNYNPDNKLLRIKFKYKVVQIDVGSVRIGVATSGGQFTAVGNPSSHTSATDIVEFDKIMDWGSNVYFLAWAPNINTMELHLTDFSVKEVLMGNHATTNFFGDMSDVLSSTEKSNLGNLLDSDDNSFVFPNGEDITDSITLGSELMNYNFADGTGVTVPSSLSSLTTFNGEMVINGGSVSSDYYTIADSTTWDVNKVYKIVVVCSAYTSGSISHQGGSRAFGVTFGVSSSIGGVGTFTNYAVPFQDGSITLRSLSFVGTISSISIKEATTTKFFNLAGTDSIDSNNLKLTNDGTTKAHVVYPFTTVIGKTYNAEIYLTTANMSGGLSLSDDLEENTLSASGSSSTTITTSNFVATRTTSYVHIKNNATNNNQYNLYDNLKIREVGLSSSGFETAVNEPVVPQVPLMRYNQKAIFYRNKNNYVSLTEQTLGANTAFTISFSFAPFEGGEHHIIGKNSLDDTFRINTAPAYGNYFHVRISGTGTNFTGLGNININEPAFYTITRTTGGVFSVYRNGVKSGTTRTDTSDFKYQYLGQALNGTWESDGLLDEFSIFNTHFSDAQVQELFNDGVACDATTHSQSSSLVGYWRNDGITQWIDRSTNSNHGTVQGSPDSITIREGLNSNKDGLGFPLTNPTGNVLRLNGVNEYVSIPPSDMSLSSQMTIEFWAKHNTGDSSGEQIVDQYDYNNNQRSYRLSIQSDEKLKFDVTSSGGSDYNRYNSDSAVSNINNWRHYAITFSSGSVIMYVDSAVFANTHSTTDGGTSIFNNTTDNLRIGSAWSASDAGTNIWNGLLDEVRIYNRALSATEISKNYKHGKGKHKND